MKVLEKKEHKLTVKWYCPHCGSLLELDSNDIKWQKDWDDYRRSVPYVKCCVCGKETIVDYDGEIRSKLI